MEKLLDLGEIMVYQREGDWELEFCKVCGQMTNHYKGKCQKCKMFCIVEDDEELGKEIEEDRLRGIGG